MEIRVAGPEAWPHVSEAVLRLLRELGEEARDLGSFDAARAEASWRSNPALLRAVIATEGGDDDVLGIATLAESFALYANGAYGILLEMYVAPAARSRGVGEALLRGAIEFGRERGWSRLEVTAPVGERWKRTVDFYEKNGFTYTGPKMKIVL